MFVGYYWGVGLVGLRVRLEFGLGSKSSYWVIELGELGCGRGIEVV